MFPTREHISFCVLMVLMQGRVCDAAEDTAVTSALKSKVNNVLFTTAKVWGDDLKVKSKVDTASTANCDGAKTLVGGLVEAGKALAGHSLAWYCDKQDPAVADEALAEAAFNTWLSDVNKYKYPGQESLAPAECTDAGKKVGYVSANQFLMLTSTTTNQIGCAKGALTASGRHRRGGNGDTKTVQDTYLACFFKNPLEDADLMTPAKVGTYIFTNDVYCDLSAKVGGLKKVDQTPLQFDTCSQKKTVQKRDRWVDSR